MPDIQFPAGDSSRTTLLGRLYQQFKALPPAERPIPAALYAALETTHAAWVPLIANRREAASTQGDDVTKLHRTQGVATMWVSHYLQVFNLGVRRGVYLPSDRALFGLPTSSGELPELYSEANLVAWLANVAAGDLALTATGRPSMVNPSAAEVAAKGLEFSTQLAARDASGHTKTTAMTKVEDLRPTVDEVLSDVYAELKHRSRKLAAPAWRDLARTYGFRFTNSRGEHPEGRYQDAIAPAELREVYEGVFAPTVRLRLRNPGLTAWEIALAPTGTEFPAGRGLRVGAGQEVRCGLPELGNIADRHLLLRNLSPDQTGAWEIEFDPHD